MNKRLLEKWTQVWFDSDTFRYVLDREPKDIEELNAFFDALHNDVFSWMTLEDFIKETYGAIIEQAVKAHYERIKKEMRVNQIQMDSV